MLSSNCSFKVKIDTIAKICQLVNIVNDLLIISVWTLFSNKLPLRATGCVQQLGESKLNKMFALHLNLLLWRNNSGPVCYPSTRSRACSQHCGVLRTVIRHLLEPFYGDNHAQMEECPPEEGRSLCDIAGIIVNSMDISLCCDIITLRDCL